MTKETFIHTMELLQKLPDSESDLAKELLNTLKCAFPDVYDWILWWLARMEHYKAMTYLCCLWWYLAQPASIWMIMYLEQG